MNKRKKILAGMFAMAIGLTARHTMQLFREEPLP